MPKKTLITLTFAILFALPLVSFAGFIQTGPSCTGDIASNQTCVYGSANDSNKAVHLKWKMPTATYAQPLCLLICKQSGGQSCTSILKKDSSNLADYTFNPNSNLWDQFNLKPTDDIFVNDTSVSDLGPGNIYQLSCCERVDNPTSLTNACQANTNKTSGTITITSPGPACEVGFGSIKQAFSTGQPVHITEKSLSDYSLTDNTDYAGTNDNGPGSGDNRNIVSLIKESQCSYETCLFNSAGGRNTCPKPVYFNSNITTLPMPQNYREKISRVIDRINQGYPMLIDFRATDWPVEILNNNLIVENHSSILVSVKQSTGDYYTFEIIDPNVPNKITYLKNCHYSTMRIKTSGFDKYDYGLGCDSPTYQADGKVLVSDFDFMDDLVLNYYNFCSLPQNILAFSNLCKRTPTQWLKNNLVDLKNPGPSCLSWTKFYLNMAYLGDFVGTDYHPGDGKYVGTDCDANHYPLSK